MSSNNTSKKIKNRPINIALIGCGRISFKHVTSIIKHKNNLKLVAICDCESNKINTIKDSAIKLFKAIDDKKNINFDRFIYSL